MFAFVINLKIITGNIRCFKSAYYSETCNRDWYSISRLFMGTVLGVDERQPLCILNFDSQSFPTYTTGWLAKQKLLPIFVESINNRLECSLYPSHCTLNFNCTA